MSKKTPDSSDNAEDGSLDEYGVWVKTGPEDSKDEGDGSIAEVLDDSFDENLFDEPEAAVSLSLDNDIRLQDPAPGTRLGGTQTMGQEVADMSEQDKTKHASLTDSDETKGAGQESEVDLELNADDDLGGLSDLLLNIDEETEQDDTIYLEDDDLSFDLNDENDDLLLEQESLDTESSDDFGEDIVIPGLDEELGLDAAEAGLDLPQDSLEGLDNIDAELAALESEPAAPPPAESAIETHDVAEVGLDEFLDAQDTAAAADAPAESDDLSDLVLDDEITLDIGSFDEEPAAQDNAVLADGAPDEGEIDLDIDLGPEIDLDEDLASAAQVDAKDELMPGVESEIDSILSNAPETSEPALPELDLEAEPAFDDVQAVADAVRGEPAAGASTGILSSIEEELHAIRTELTDLRAELKKLRGRDSADAAIAADEPAADDELEMTVDAAKEDTKSGGGFFDDDDDETIALTGDELDNILNTAEFTEEVGESSAPDLDDDAEPEKSGDVPVSSDAFTFSDSEQEKVGEEPVFEDNSANEEFPPIEEISLEELDDASHASAATADDRSGSEGENPEVAQLAQLDIEKELAGIEDLKDEEEDIELFTGEDISGLELEIPEDFDKHAESAADDTVGESDIGEIQGLEEASAIADVPAAPPADAEEVSFSLKQEIKAVLAYMDQLLDSLPEDKIKEFAQSEHFEVYKKLFDELGL